MRKASWIPKEELEEFYQNHSYVETLEHFNIKGGKLDRMLKAYKIGKNTKALENREQVNKEDLERYYVEENHSKLETQTHFNLTEYGLSVLFKQYGIRKSKKKVISLRKETSLERYGDENYNGREKFKRTYESRYGGIGFASEIIRTQAENTTKERYGDEDIRKTEYFKQKISKTKEERYGDPKYNNLEKRRETCLARYGEDNPQRVEEIKEKTTKTCQERYGSRYNQDRVRETKEERYGDPNFNNLELRRKNNFEKYGYEYTFQIPEIKEKVSKTCQEKYGVNWACMRPEARNYSSDSGPNRYFAELLEKQGTAFEREFPIQNKSYDFKIGDTLVEINPSATHNSTWGILGGEPKKSIYHLEKSQIAEKEGYHCIHVWDWDHIEKVARSFTPKETVYARKCEVVQLDPKEVNLFLDENHYQGRCMGQKVCLGLKDRGELIQVMTFGKPRYNKNYQWELLRLCTKAGKVVLGGSQKLFKAFVDNEDFQVQSVISYCDKGKFSGKVYESLGFTLRGSSRPSKHWWNGKEHITDNLLRQRGFDQLFGDRWGRYGKGTSNEDLMREHGFVEVYDAGQASYVWIR